MVIAFVHGGQSFMPEINAYVNYFSTKNISCLVTTSKQLKKIKRDVEWFFLGTDRSVTEENIIRIHEYASASTAPMAKCKDFIKKTTNTKPDFRIFLNDFVKKRFDFTDGIPFGFRDMGVPKEWLTEQNAVYDKQFDFIYIGDISAKRQIDRLLTLFTNGALKEKRIIIISQQYEKIQKQYETFKNIVFTGPLAHAGVKDYLLSARYAINFIPDVIPYNQQTSTKLLEYVATQIPVISSNYHWVNQFKSHYGGNYFYLEPDFSNVSWEAINTFKYAFPDMTNWTWEKQIEGCGILPFLKAKFIDCPL